MFGYVKVNKPEMKVKEYEAYRGLYCSLCKSMGKYFGLFSRLTLSYDVTFLLLMRLSFTVCIPEFKGGRCSFNPLKKCNYCTNAEEELKYAAAVAMMLFYHKIKDNISDGTALRKLLMYLILPYAALKYKKAKKMFPQIAKSIFENMTKQALTEKTKTPSCDKAAHESADALGKIFSFGIEKNKDKVYRFGYGVGKFVYLCDAADDITKDISQNNYNCFAIKYELSEAPSEEIKEEIEQTLNMSAAMVCEAFSEIKDKSLVPIVENIIYDGMEITMINILKGKEKDERSV